VTTYTSNDLHASNWHRLHYFQHYTNAAKVGWPIVMSAYSLMFQSPRSSGKQRRSVERSEETMSYVGKHTIQVGKHLVGQLIGKFIISEIAISLERRCEGCLVAALETDLLPICLTARRPYPENPSSLDTTSALHATANDIIICMRSSCYLREGL
jgi:hypothetical protein